MKSLDLGKRQMTLQKHIVKTLLNNVQNRPNVGQNILRIICERQTSLNWATNWRWKFLSCVTRLSSQTLSRQHRRKTVNFGEIVFKMNEEFCSNIKMKSIARKIENLYISQFKNEGNEEHAALKELTKEIRNLAPQTPVECRSDRDRKRIFCDTTRAIQWALQVSSAFNFMKLTYQQLLHELENALQQYKFHNNFWKLLMMTCLERVVSWKPTSVGKEDTFRRSPISPGRKVMIRHKNVGDLAERAAQIIDVPSQLTQKDQNESSEIFRVKKWDEVWQLSEGGSFWVYGGVHIWGWRIWDQLSSESDGESTADDDEAKINHLFGENKEIAAKSFHDSKYLWRDICLATKSPGTFLHIQLASIWGLQKQKGVRIEIIGAQ